MKSNVKRFLSTLCVLTSVSGIFAPALVKASSDVEKYGNDFCGEGDHSVCSSAAAAATVTEDVSCDPATILMPLLRKENHQKFYDKVVELMNKNLISKPVAVLLIIVDQSIETGFKIESSYYGKKGTKEWVVSDSHVENMIRSGKFVGIDDCLIDIDRYVSEMSQVITPENDLDYRAISIFSQIEEFHRDSYDYDCDYYREHSISLDRALERLNPSNPKGLCEPKVYKDSNSDLNESGVEAVDSAAAASAVSKDVSYDYIDVIMPLLRKGNHQDFYDKVMELKENGVISEFTAFMLILIDQMMVFGKVYFDPMGEFSDNGWIVSDSEIETALRSGNWDKCVKEIYLQDLNVVARRYYTILSKDSLERRAVQKAESILRNQYYKKLYTESHNEHDLDELKIVLKELNPSNPKDFI